MSTTSSSLSTGSSSRIGPPAGLVVANQKPAGFTPPPGTPDEIFALQTTAWVNLQATVAAGLKLPITQGNFVAQYGNFAGTQAAEIQDAIGYFSAINTSCTDFGDPTTLISQITQFTSATTPPLSLYGHGVWLAQQLAVTAQTISEYYTGTIAYVNAGHPWQPACSQLFSQAGVLSNAQAMTTLCQKFSSEMSTFLAALTANVDALNTYVSSDSANVLSTAQTDLTNDTTDLTSDTAQLAKLNQEYIGFTVAAALSPVISLEPPLFLIDGIIDAAVFTGLAVAWKTKIDNLKATIASLKTEKQQAAALVTQVTSFNSFAALTVAQGQSFIDAVDQMAAGLIDFQTQLTAVESELNNFDSFDDFFQQIHMQAAIDDWNNVASYANSWVTQGFVQFQT